MKTAVLCLLVLIKLCNCDLSEKRKMSEDVRWKYFRKSFESFFWENKTKDFVDFSFRFTKWKPLRDGSMFMMMFQLESKP